MKKTLLSVLVTLLTVITFGQSQRFILFEEFTNACCGPCASQNPAFDALLTTNAGKCTSIKYHTNWLGPDPMNTQNPTEVATRVTYYGVSGVPHAVMDGSPLTGSSYSGAPANLTQTKIDNEYAVPSPFELFVNQHLSPNNDTIFVTVLGKATQEVTGTLVAHIAVIEKHIHFNSAPGSNGEKDFYNVMKKMLPKASGTTLPNHFFTGDYFIIEQAWALENVYDINELNVVGFIQNNQNKNVLQAANTSADPINGVYENDIELMSLSNLTPTYCTNSLAPVVNIRNNGSLPLNSVTFQYKVNDGMYQSYTWTGALNTLEKAAVQLPALDYTLKENNELTVFASGINGGNDNYPKNDTIHYSFTDALQVGTTATVKIKTDNNPQETTWTITDASGAIIASGGPYTNAATTYTQDVNLDFGTCYQFTIYDAGGNGICCKNGNGYYKVTSGSTTIESGTQFGSSESAQFYSQSGVGIPSLSSVIKTSLFPNPVKNLATLSFENDRTENVSINVFDILGNTVIRIPATQYPAGLHQATLDCGNLSNGLYNVRLCTGSRSINLKMTVNK
ncbi:MAG TPA: T9SS type A sorting domain-containing protein [Bacteroidales bacterium]|nr:T9SS type A sorting domain-containing protein [Bacteroidales bacterium]